MKTIKELLGLSEAKKKKMKGEDPCWDNYEMVGTKEKNSREVPNCVSKNEEVEIYEAKVGDTVSFHHELKAAPGTKMKKSGTVEKVQGDDVLVKVKDKYGVKRHQVKMGDLVKENFGADFLAMARQKNPNARLVTPDQKKKEAEELAKKRAGLKPAHAAPTSNPRPLGDHDPKSNRSYSEEVEGVTEMDNRTPSGDRREKRNNSPEAIAQREKEQQKRLKSISPEMRKKLRLPEPKEGVAEGVEQVDELNKDTVYSYNKKSTADTEKLHKKLGEFIHKNKSAEANKTAHKLNKRVAGQERADARLNTEEAALEEAKAKKEETPSKKDIVKGEKLSGKQEPVNVNPELKEK